MKKAFAAIKEEPCFEPCAEVGFDGLEQWLERQIALLLKLRERNCAHFSPTVANALVHIEKHYDDKNLSIEQIARSVFVSSNWLSVKFKAEVGCTINEYITQFRINKAKNLLLFGKYKIYEVAEMVGYGSSRYFSKVFSRLTNQTPQNYRGD